MICAHLKRKVSGVEILDMSGTEGALRLYFQSLPRCRQYMFPDDLQQYLESWTLPIALYLFETSLLETCSFKRGGSPSHKICLLARIVLSFAYVPLPFPLSSPPREHLIY